MLPISKERYLVVFSTKVKKNQIKKGDSIMKSQTKRGMVLMVAIFFVFCLLFTMGLTESSAQKIILHYGAGPVGSGAYATISGHTQLINSKVKNVEIVQEVTSGGMDNIKLFAQGRIDIGGAGPNQIYEAHRGIGMFKGKKVENMGGLFPLYYWRFAIVVMADNKIKSFDDIRGKKISVGLKGSGSLTHTLYIFETLGLKKGDYKPFYLGYRETNDAFRTGAIDAATYTTGHPVPALLELEVARPIRVVPLTSEQMKKVNTKYAYYVPGTLSAGTYKGQDRGIPTLTGLPFIFMRRDFSEKIVYTMTKAFWENTEFLKAVHPSQKELSLDMVKKSMMPLLPLHPGAERYYREIGLLK
jgi:TRAP transporter TAXI family solute receptor